MERKVLIQLENGRLQSRIWQTIGITEGLHSDALRPVLLQLAAS